MSKNRTGKAATPPAWTCPNCTFTTDSADAGLAHIADHEAGRAVALTDAQLAAAYEVDERGGAGPVPGCGCEDCAEVREAAGAPA